MNRKSKFIVAAAAALMIISAPAYVLAQAAPGGGGGSSSGGEGGTYGFGSAYHNIEIGEHSCDRFRKRAQWSDSYYWWRKYSRCVDAGS
ncbi:MAG: hypothetical protein HKN05_02925 [Rhizobiales bacterium]|nr:hypothetical protein [Hyphomicrobiales bacterium]